MLWIYHWLNYSNLRLTSLGLLALSSFCVLVGLFALKSAAPLLGSLISKLRLLQLQERTPNSVSGYESFSPLQGSHPNLYPLVDNIKVYVTAGLVVVLALSSIWVELKEKPVYTYYDVRFVQKITPYSWWMEKATGGFRADFCNDYNVPELNPQPGEILRKLRYRDMGGCWSIRDQDLGFWFYRDDNHWTVDTDLSTDLETALRGIKANEQRKR